MSKWPNIDGHPLRDADELLRLVTEGLLASGESLWTEPGFEPSDTRGICAFIVEEETWELASQAIECQYNMDSWVWYWLRPEPGMVAQEFAEGEPINLLVDPTYYECCGGPFQTASMSSDEYVSSEGLAWVSLIELEGLTPPY